MEDLGLEYGLQGCPSKFYFRGHASSLTFRGTFGEMYVRHLIKHSEHLSYFGHNNISF